jgi:hypothetical protein
MKKLAVFVLVVCLTVLAGAVLAQQQAPPPQAAPAGKAAPAPAAGLTIARMEIASSVENREPVGVAATFPATQEKVYCFLEFQNVPAETSVTVVWTLGLNEMGNVPLTIKPFSKFRTWANKTIGGMKGDWKVEVKDASGTVLKSATFKIE